MKSKNKIKTLIVSIIVLVLIFFIYKKNRIIVGEIDYDKFEDYDLILTKGQSIQSKLISLLNLSLEDYSHVGVISKVNGKIFILHSTPDGTENNGIRYDDLQTFIDLSDVCDYKLLRYKHITSDIHYKIKSEFEKYKTTSVPFDYDFNNYDHKKIYCTELILIIYKNSGLLKMIDSNFGKPIYPKDFLKMNDFILVQ
ncbi:MAG: hypothetical protein FD143_2971 [Ignavibacteria bacterium]|nr:MAG: hypothetical protein FD143_2971 [Ignavibacteria bacterium]KAF0155230.1 MAG: hypothetical protein FD188_3177 [Ignavibacteria bacterium]